MPNIVTNKAIRKLVLDEQQIITYKDYAYEFYNLIVKPALEVLQNQDILQYQITLKQIIYFIYGYYNTKLIL